MLKVGLVGWGASTGNGGMNYDIARLAPWVISWLCPKHPSFGWHEPYINEVSEKVIKCEREGDTEVYNRFLDHIDSVLFVEHPYLRNYELVDECKKRGIFTICIPMWEWFPEQEAWSKSLDMVWCTTKYTRQYLQTLANYLKHRHDRCDWNNKIYGDRWGVELEKFDYIPRKQANRFLFVNGNGGGRALRKGSETIAQMAIYIPNIEITMVTQGNNYVKPMPDNVNIIEYNFSSKVDVYQHGDVLLSPTHWEGFGHTLYEAQACGLPVITIDAPPMNECGTDWLIPISYSEQYQLFGKPIPKVFANPQELAKLLVKVQGTDISQKSSEGKHHIEQHHNLKKIIDNLGIAIEHAISITTNKLNVKCVEQLEQTENYFDSKEQYQTLVEQAWNAYLTEDLDSMSNLLEQSYKYSLFLKTEIILDWISRFYKFSLDSDKEFNIKKLTNSIKWNKLIINIINSDSTMNF
jgi:glycosyltransferase involved in cell wall biosynthesis